MKLSIIRHGETKYNVQMKVQGQVDSELTEKGINQAYEAEKKLEDDKFFMIVSSPLKRTRELAKIINSDRNMEIIYDDRLLERSYGKIERKKGKNINFKKMWDYDENYSGNEIETVRDFMKRTNNLLEELNFKYKGKKILLVTHSGNSIAINCFYNGMPEDREILNLGLGNCEIKEYRI